ncbi:Clan SB, family S8, subtilisin-like serine peptidase [Histomonas meleagridis]|uniref:Clan SB, family S8, subtilisin-like serine peptidase n=1 Tax=Histomonas meleagridis TaxID=135588 RepID=UPI00355A609C|nr:Clan SB, family S8, subtilisin-like serine peptidase [Histomonas meleagridis]KAH0806756.1 Clan SB, family S8, subtilisin-like serine peptidase [Histomonas meleagridis]
MVLPSLTAFKLGSQYQTRGSYYFTQGWFIVEILTAITNLTLIQNEAGIRFLPENLIQTGVFKLYLSTKQIEYLENQKNIFKLYPIESNKKIKQVLDLNTDYYVEATNDWHPTNAIIKEKISNFLYRVSFTKPINSDPNILHIIPAPKMRLLNRYTTGFLQSHISRNIYQDDIYAPPRVIHSLGLTGEGEIVNVVDTGIDISHPMFRDPMQTLDSITGKTNYNHRKVVRIEPLVDNKDYSTGHGTHVCGIIAGNTNCSDCALSQYNGVAPESKLFVYDAGNSEYFGDLSGEVNLDELIELMKSVGSYISSNSWSYNSPSSIETYKFNLITYNNPNILFVFAAGNDYEFNSINCPSDSKNVLTVSAANTVSAMTNEKTNLVTIISNEFNRTYNGTDKNRNIYKMSITTPIKYFINVKTIFYNKTIDDYQQKIVFIDGNITNNFCDIIQEIISNNASIIIYNESIQSQCITSRSIPIISINNKEIYSYDKLTILPYEGLQEIPSVSEMSSKGPSSISVSKPDIMSPGINILSAYSHGPEEHEIFSTDISYSITPKSGTSMATPFISGVASIIRQFFVQSWYPYIKKGIGVEIIPTSCLLRAMIINCAIPTVKDKSGPGLDCGFGIPSLKELFLNNEMKGIRIIDQETIKTNSHKAYEIYITTNTTDLRITMCYLDPPLNYENVSPLFSDLDLVVLSPNGKYYYGNNLTFSDSDQFSTIERIIIPMKDIIIGKYEIHIFSNEYPMDNIEINYAIVVNGGFNNTDLNTNPLYLKSINTKNYIANCNGKGKSINGICKCNNGYIGISCNTKVITLNSNTSIQRYLYYKEVAYYKIQPSVNLSVEISISRMNSLNAFYCYSTTDIGKVTNGYWTCNTFGLSLKENFEYGDDGTLYLAVFISNAAPVKVVISVGNFTGIKTDEPDGNNNGINKNSIFVIVMAVCLFVIGFVIIVVLIVLDKRNKERIVKSDSEESDPNKMKNNLINENNEDLILQIE